MKIHASSSFKDQTRIILKKYSKNVKELIIKKRTSLSILLVLINLVFNYSITAGTDKQRIILDEDFSDWKSVPLLWSSNETTSAGNLTLQRLKADNDEQFLFIYFKTAEIFSLQEDFELKLYVDSDHNSSTGLAVNGMGAEIEFTFNLRKGKVYINNDNYNIGFPHLFMVTSPTVRSDEYELSIDLNAKIGGRRIFNGNSIRILMRDESSQVSGRSETDVVTYTINDGLVEPLPSYSVNKRSHENLRIVSHNVEFDGFFGEEEKPSFERIYRSIQPDIIGFSEIYNHTPAELAARLEEILPSQPGKNWNAAKIADNFIATRYTILGSYWCGSYGNGAFYIDLRPDYPTHALVLVAHPPCCSGNDNSRQLEVDAMAAFIRDAKNPGGSLTITDNSPIIIVGDMNFVGDPQQLQTLVKGDIVNEGQFGTDFKPDWNDEDLIDAKPYVSNLPMTFTQGVGTYAGTYAKGRLDYIIFSGSVLDLQNSYVLYTNALPSDSLLTYSLQSDDSESASDHFPVVADFSVSTDLSIAPLKENKTDGSPVLIDRIRSVSGIVTVSDTFGSNGPAFIQDHEYGIAIYGSPFVSQLNPGDSVSLTGKVGFFRGMTELMWDELNSSVTIHKQADIPDPLITTVADILNQEWNGMENLEGMLIALENMTFTDDGVFVSGQSYKISDGLQSVDLRITGSVDLAGTPIPVTPVRITGILGQYKPEAPYNSGYQILPRSKEDINVETNTITTHIPDDYFLSQNYPNPFNPVTTIRYRIPEDAFVEIALFDVRGNYVSILVNDVKKSGNHTLTIQGDHLSAGIYFCRMVSNNYKHVRKLMVLK